MIITTLCTNSEKGRSWSAATTDFQQKWMNWMKSKNKAKDVFRQCTCFGLREIHTIIIIWPQMKYIYNENEKKSWQTRRDAVARNPCCSNEVVIFLIAEKSQCHNIWIGIGSSIIKGSFPYKLSLYLL